MLKLLSDVISLSLGFVFKNNSQFHFDNLTFSFTQNETECLSSLLQGLWLGACGFHKKTLTHFTLSGEIWNSPRVYSSVPHAGNVLLSQIS